MRNWNKKQHKPGQCPRTKAVHVLGTDIVLLALGTGRGYAELE